MSLSREEQETVIRRAADESQWTVWTEDPAMIRKLTKQYGPGQKDGDYGFLWMLDKTRISFTKPRNYTPAQKKAMREHGKRLKEGQYTKQQP